MVKRAALALALTACNVEGVVLVVPSSSEAGVLDASIDAARDAELALDAQPLLDAQEASTVDAAPTQGACKVGGASEGFYESFPNGPLAARWLIADGVQSFGSFARSNVAIVNGDLVLSANAQGAAIATRDLFASGTYQVQLRVTAGVQLSVWWRRDDDSDGTIEIAAPGVDASHVLMRTRDGAGQSEEQLMIAPSLSDGRDLILRFDRYTTNSPSVSFWVDDVARWSTDQHLPSQRAGRLWIAATGSGSVRVSNAFVTPFGNSGDACRDGELSGPGLVAP